MLVCPQEFKGTLSATRATEVIAQAVRAALPDAALAGAALTGLTVIEQPMADGGPGTAEIIGRARAGVARSASVHDAYGRPTDAEFVLIEDGHIAVIDSAAAVGLTATALERRDPLRSTSRGVGELILAAVEAGAEQVILGVGGTASSDGGAGAARALGVQLLDGARQPLPDEAVHLARLVSVQLAHVQEVAAPGLRAALERTEVRIAVDVQNPLTGPDGAVAVYGAQKGLLEWQAPALDAAITNWARRLRDGLGRDVEQVPGAGAGGGIPAGILAAVPAASIESGAALVAEAVGLSEQIAAADLVVTGEGSLDAQTSFGKSVAHVTELARRAGTPCLAVAGVIEAVPAGVADAEAAAPADDPRAALEEPERFVGEATRRLIARWLASQEV